MIMNDIMQMVSSLGFPIVMAFLLFWKMDRQDDTHKEEISKLEQAINSNTLVMQKLVDKLSD